MDKILSILMLLVGFNVDVVHADVFGYADESGAIYLTDTPSGEHYQLLLASPVEPSKEVVAESEQNPSEDVSTSSKLLHNLRYLEEVKVAAKSSGVETALLHAVITAESNYNYRATSPKGARGLMQLMPVTAKRFGVSNMYDPGQNIQGGALYLAYLLKLFNNDFKLAIAAYNAGENAVIQHGNKIPPYSETVNYVSKVMGLYKKLRTI